MKCDKCGEREARIFIEGAGKFCLDCHNEMLASRMGIKLHTDYAKHVSIIDSEETMRTFEIRHMLMPLYSQWEAVEVGGDAKFAVMVDTAEDQERGLVKLQAKMLLGLGCRSIGKEGLRTVGTGRIMVDKDTPGLVIDGKWLSFEDFGHLAAKYEGFILEYQFKDAYGKAIGKDMALKQVKIHPDAVYNRFKKKLRLYTEDRKIRPGLEAEFIEAVEDSIEELALMMNYGYREEGREVSEEMVCDLMEIAYQAAGYPEGFLKEIDLLVWYTE